MATTSRTPDRSTAPQSETQPSPSSNNATIKGICLSFNEAIYQPPMFLQNKNEHEQHEGDMFSSQVDEIHKPDNRYASAKSIISFIKRVHESTPEAEEVALHQGILSPVEAFDRLLELHVQLPFITGDIATEITCNVINGVDSHNMVFSMMIKLQKLNLGKSIVAFGDFELNLCEESKVMTSSDPKVKVDVWIHFEIAIYWITKPVVTNSTSHTMKIPNRGYKQFRTVLHKAM